MPRKIDPCAREVQGLYLFDLDDLERDVQHKAGERETAAVEA
jgi:glutamyl-tRNA reductase